MEAGVSSSVGPASAGSQNIRSLQMGCAASSGVVFDSICSHGNQIGNCKECLRIEQHAKLDPSGGLRHQFHRWDTDRDGKLTLDELHDGLVNDMVEQDDIVGLFEVMDRNHDGTVSLDEYLMHKARTTLLQQSVCFIREKSLRDLKRIPRRGSDTHFKHPLTGRHNDNVHWPCSQLEASASKICYGQWRTFPAFSVSLQRRASTLTQCMRHPAKRASCLAQPFLCLISARCIQTQFLSRTNGCVRLFLLLPTTAGMDIRTTTIITSTS